MFKPKIQKREYTDAEAGETFEFYVRRASLREVVKYDKTKIKDLDGEGNLREMFSSYVVNADGTPIPAAKVEEMIDFEIVAGTAISRMVAEAAGLTAAAEQPKKD